MTKHLQREIARLKELLLELSALVEDAVTGAVEAVEKVDVAQAQRIIAADDRIDTMEVALEEECLKVLALHQPVATDLRLIVAVLKINNDLERIADLADNIAGRAKNLAEYRQQSIAADFMPMANAVKSMLHDSLDALIHLDAAKAHAVCEADPAVDRMHRAMYGRAQEAIQRDPSRAPQAITLLSVSRNLERIGDHATNIAEDVIYLIEGVIVRHTHHD